jgi:hypothetical protein
MINKFRRLLIQIGKTLPFVICFLVCLNYAESTFALIAEDYLDWNGIIIPNTRISFFIGQYFEYNIQMLVVLVIISIAIQTCVYNKIACFYLGANLHEKSWFSEHEYENEVYYIISIANIIICTFLCYKGIKIILRKQIRQ